MNYTSFADMADTIRRNLWKVPHDIDLIVGVPRSGLMAALMLGEIMNRRVVSLPEFLRGDEPQTGSRGHLVEKTYTNRVLVLDDTVFSGGSMLRARKAVEAAGKDKEYDVLFGCVYAEGRDARERVDIWLEYNYNAHEELWHLYEWNILHHGNKLSQRCMFDIDGLLCKEPPDERHTQEYEQYIEYAAPMVIPTTEIGAIVTYRLRKYQPATEKWLYRNGIRYQRLIMCPAVSYVDRANMVTPAVYKAKIYKDAKWALLFVESDRKQAEEIARLSGKQVFCYENGKMYG